MKVAAVYKNQVECKANHLSSFAMVVLGADSVSAIMF